MKKPKIPNLEAFFLPGFDMRTIAGNLISEVSLRDSQDDLDVVETEPLKVIWVNTFRF